MTVLLISEKTLINHWYRPKITDKILLKHHVKTLKQNLFAKFQFIPLIFHFYRGYPTWSSKGSEGRREALGWEHETLTSQIWNQINFILTACSLDVISELGGIPINQGHIWMNFILNEVRNNFNRQGLALDMVYIN